jgi:hypothetical protein
MPEDFFAAQHSSTSDLPDPTRLLKDLTRCTIEALAGARELDQLARWVTEDVYRSLLKRVILASRSRRARGVSARRPRFVLGTLRITEPCDGVLETVIRVDQPHRCRVVAIRLEGRDGRWRATAIAVL